MTALLTDDVCGNKAMATGSANANDNVVTTALNGRCKRGLRCSSLVLTQQSPQSTAIQTYNIRNKPLQLIHTFSNIQKQLQKHTIKLQQDTIGRNVPNPKQVDFCAGKLQT